MLFLVTFEPPRSDFWATLSGEEKMTLEAQFKWLVDLHTSGEVKFAGRSDDQKFGLVIVEAAHRSNVEHLLTNSPAIKAKMYTAVIAEWHVPPDAVG